MEIDQLYDTEKMMRYHGNAVTWMNIVLAAVMNIRGSFRPFLVRLWNAAWLLC